MKLTTKLPRITKEDKRGYQLIRNRLSNFNNVYRNVKSNIDMVTKLVNSPYKFYSILIYYSEQAITIALFKKLDGYGYREIIK